jgi:putative ABC transport system substrate-binding protein
MRWPGTLTLVVFAGLIFWSDGGFAQTPARTYTVGFLTPGHDSKMFGPREFTLAELARQGFVEGRNLKVEWRFAGGADDRLPALARELVAAKVDAIVAVSSGAIKAAKQSTDRIPIIMSFAGEDPVADGLIASLARPGGNITGIVLLGVEGELKRIEMLHETLPTARRIGYLVSPVHQNVVASAREYARRSGFELDVVTAGGRGDYDGIFAVLSHLRPAALAIASFPTFFNDGADLAARADALGIPSICEWREMAVMGCTLAFGPSLGSLFERVGWYVAKVLRGESPGAIPVEQPTTFELVVNLAKARAMGVGIPPAIFARANEVIE